MGRNWKKIGMFNMRENWDLSGLILLVLQIIWIELISGLLGVHKQFLMVSINDKAEKINFLFTDSFLFDRVTKLLNKHASRLWTHLHHLNMKISRKSKVFAFLHLFYSFDYARRWQCQILTLYSGLNIS